MGLAISGDMIQHNKFLTINSSSGNVNITGDNCNLKGVMNFSWEAEEAKEKYIKGIIQPHKQIIQNAFSKKKIQLCENIKSQNKK